jgi:hypothetical protein
MAQPVNRHPREHPREGLAHKRVIARWCGARAELEFLDHRAPRLAHQLVFSAAGQYRLGFFDSLS